MGRYGQSLDLGKELENEAAQEEARKAQDAPPETPKEERAKPPVSEEPKSAEEASQPEEEFPEEPKPEPVIVVTPVAEKAVAEEPILEEPDEPKEPPRRPDPGEEDVVEMLSKHMPHAFVPRKKSRAWFWVLIVVALGAGAWWFVQGGNDASAQIPDGLTPSLVVPQETQAQIPVPQNVSTSGEDVLSRLLAEGLQDAHARNRASS